MSLPPPTGPVDPHSDDALPAELLPGFVGPYRFPDTARRRIPAVMYLIVGAACIVAWVAARTSVLVNVGFLLAGLILLAMAIHHLLASWSLGIDEIEALARAGASLGYAVGPASAALAWRGWRSRPVWRVLVYSTEDPPARRGIVEVDGVDGSILLSFAEENPEDWSTFDVAEDAEG